MKKLIAVLSLAFVFVTALSAAESKWMDNYNDALKKAEKENKLVLADFSGSDWCGWCIKLDKEVFSQKKFLDFADKNFILLMVDFPKKKKLSPELTKQNQELSQKYGIKGFPSVLILDSKGKVIKQTGYEDGGADAYVKMLQGVIEKNAAAATKK